MFLRRQGLTKRCCLVELVDIYIRIKGNYRDYYLSINIEPFAASGPMYDI